MKNKKIFIVIGVVLFIIFGFIIFKISNKYIEENNNIEKLFENHNYNRIYNLIKDKDLLNTDNKENIYKIIEDNINKYKINNKEDYLKFTDKDINDIKNFNDLIKKLVLYEKYDYLNKLVAIDDKLHDYMEAVRWYNSEEYKIYKSNMEIKELTDYEKSGKLMKNYSFDKYGKDDILIKELSEEIKKYVNYCEKFSTALNNKDSNLDDISREFQDNLYQINHIEITIKAKDTDLSNAINKLVNDK